MWECYPISMTIQIKLNSETEALLIAEARAKGVPPERVAEKLLEEALRARPRPQGRMSIEQFHQMLREMGGGSEKLPNLPTESFTRESFYEDLD
jgi:hypothetical protein